MKVVSSAIVVLLIGGNSATVLAQDIPVQHWILMMRSPSGDSVARPMRMQWKGDSLFVELAGGDLIVGAVAREAISAEMRYRGTGSAVRLTGKRETPGTMSGDWTGNGRVFRMGAAQTGTWNATRTVASMLAPQGAGNLAERWILTRIPSADRLADGSEPQSVHADLTWRGDSLIGMFPSGTAPMVGSVQGGRVDALWPDRDNRVLRLRGTRAGRDSITGTWVSLASPAQSGGWIAARVGGGRPPRSASYAPVKWYTTYSPANAPELRVAPLDTIRARAQDPNYSGPGILPAPIYVEGALPGDVLVVHILHIRPSVPTAYSQRTLLLEWFTTEFAQAAQRPSAIVWNWKLDTLAGVARLDASCAPGCPAVLRLKDVTIPLRPMIGNIGVAPEGMQAIPVPHEGAHGGNLDYKWLRDGVTMYFPVFHSGALLSVANDMHAAQGDGELAGTGLEMGADVDFVVDVIRGANVTQVRAEDATYRMAFGVSADLAQALRLANTNLAEWLARDYHLNQQDLAFLMGSALELDVANVWGAQTTVVAKIRKSLLAQIKP